MKINCDDKPTIKSNAIDDAKEVLADNNKRKQGNIIKLLKNNVMRCLDVAKFAKIKAAASAPTPRAVCKKPLVLASPCKISTAQAGKIVKSEIPKQLINMVIAISNRI